MALEKGPVKVSRPSSQGTCPKARDGGRPDGHACVGGGGEQVPRNKQINASVKKAPARRNWPQSGDLPAFPPTPTPTYLGMDLAGQQGVVRVRDAGTPRAPEAGNRGGTPGPASRPPPANSGSAEPLGRAGRRAVGGGPRGPGHGGRRRRAAEGRRGWGGRREAGGADERRTAPELERAAGGRERGAPGPGAGALRRSSGRQAAGEDQAAAARGWGWSLARLCSARASGRGLEARGLRAAGAAEEPERPAVRGRAAAARPSRAACEAKPSLY